MLRNHLIINDLVCVRILSQIFDNNVFLTYIRANLISFIYYHNSLGVIMPRSILTVFIIIAL